MASTVKTLLDNLKARVEGDLETPEAKEAFIQVIVEHCPHNKTLLDWLKTQLSQSDQDFFVRKSLCSIITEYWRDDQEVEGWFYHLFFSEVDYGTQALAVEAIASLGTHDPESTCRFLEMIAFPTKPETEPWSLARVVALRALVQIYRYRDPSTLNSIMELVASEADENLRTLGIKEVLRCWHDTPALLPVIQDIANYSDSPLVASTAFLESAYFQARMEFGQDHLINF